MPRDAGGSIEITEGTGPIRAMVSTGEFLEIYKLDKTFRLATPESIDPGRTNPNAPFVVSPTHDFGTSNWIIARVLLQSNEILDCAFLGLPEVKNAILRELHQCKELLLRCEISASRIGLEIDAIRNTLARVGVPVEKRVLNPFPQVKNLEADCSTFLVEANRAIRVISGLPSLFIALERTDNNFDHLRQRLEQTIGNGVLTQFVASCAPGITRLADMRNYFEHPKIRKTIIKNFHLLPNGKVSLPIWHLSDQEPVLLCEDMSAAIAFLVGVSEQMLIHLVMYHGREQFAFQVDTIPNDNIDSNCPMKYKVTACFK